MKLEQFWYGLTNGDGYIFKRSSKILSILSEKTLEYLKKLPIHEDYTVSWLPKEQTIAISAIAKAKDKDGREGKTNHTVLIPVKQYISLTILPSRFYAANIKFTVPESNILEPLEV